MDKATTELIQPDVEPLKLSGRHGNTSFSIENLIAGSTTTTATATAVNRSPSFERFPGDSPYLATNGATGYNTAAMLSFTNFPLYNPWVGYLSNEKLSQLFGLNGLSSGDKQRRKSEADPPPPNPTEQTYFRQRSFYGESGGGGGGTHHSSARIYLRNFSSDLAVGTPMEQDVNIDRDDDGPEDCGGEGIVRGVGTGNGIDSNDDGSYSDDISLSMSPTGCGKSGGKKWFYGYTDWITGACDEKNQRPTWMGQRDILGN